MFTILRRVFDRLNGLRVKIHGIESVIQIKHKRGKFMAAVADRPPTPTPQPPDSADHSSSRSASQERGSQGVPSLAVDTIVSSGTSSEKKPDAKPPKKGFWSSVFCCFGGNASKNAEKPAKAGQVTKSIDPDQS